MHRPAMIALPTARRYGSNRCFDLAVTGKNSGEVDPDFAIVTYRPGEGDFEGARVRPQPRAIAVDSEVGAFNEFTIRLPRQERWKSRERRYLDPR